MNISPPSGNPSEAKHCVQCGATLPAGRLEGLCAACLLQQGAMTDAPTNVASAPFEPPTLTEVARLFPQLEILAFIGRGGMGAVYKARQPALDRFIALKLLAPHRTDSGFAERFGREARALAKLVHPNIVAVHDFGQVEGWNYIIMEFVDGVNLRQLERAGRLSPREALQIVPQVCDALQFAHDNGIVHRDIKPENVLMDTRGRVKIADFGIAKILERHPDDRFMTGSQEVMGTPHYMAPEQVERPQEVDHRADIYSLGVVFYELLTGELPLGKFQPPSRRVTVDVRLDEVVLRALEKAPEMRYQTAADFRTGLETVMVAPNAAPPSTTTEDEEEYHGLTLNEQLWKAIPVVAILMAFFNPWGGRGWLYFAAGCAVLGVLPTIPLGPSPHVAHRRRIYEALGLRSRWAQWCCSLGWLGCIGFLGFLPAWQPLQGFFGFFGFCGLAVIVEGIARRRNEAAGTPLAPPANRRQLLRSMGYRTFVAVLIALAIALFLRAFFVQSFVAATDAAAPEIPRGSHMLVWKLSREFDPGDLVAYNYQGRPCVGRVSSSDSRHVTLSHYKKPDVRVRLDDIVGKVVSVYWRGKAPPSGIAFGPVTEVTLPEPAEGVPCVLSFKSGDLLMPPRSVLQLFSKGMPDLDKGALDWLRAAEADAVLKKPYDGSLRMIEGVALSPAINGRSLGWDELTPEKLLKFCTETHGERTKVSENPAKGFYACNARSPAVICFVTRDGSMGLLEMFGQSQPMSGMRLRYKMLQSKLAPTRAEVAAGVSASTNDAFEPEQRCELGSAGSLDRAFLDLDTGKVLSPPADLVEVLRKRQELQPGLPMISSVQDWMRASGADVFLPMRDSKESGMFFQVDGISDALAEKSDMQAVEYSFDKVTASRIEQVLDFSATLRKGLAEPLHWRCYATIVWAFRTREGHSGVLEIYETSGAKIKIRSKLIKKQATSAVKTPLQPREVAAAWLRAVKEGRDEDAWALTCNPDAGWSPSLTSLEDFDTIKPLHQLGDEAAAMVVTNPFVDKGDPPRVLLFQLRKVDGLWRIDSHAMRMPSDASYAMDGFKANPSVRYDLQPDEFIGDWHALSQRITLRADGTGSHQVLVPVESTDRCEWQPPTDLRWSVSGSTITVTHPTVGGKVEILHIDSAIFRGRHTDDRSFSFYRDEKPAATATIKDSATPALAPAGNPK